MSAILAGQRGFTLIEVLMAVVIIGILASVALRSVQQGIESSRIRETQVEMQELINAIGGNPDLYANGLRADFGYVGDVGSVPSTLDNLITNPGGYTTWRGPYVRNRFTQDPTGFKKDAWGNLYTFTGGITISSTGGGATAMTKSAASAATDLTSTTVSGTVTDAAGNPPGDSSVAVTVSITYPNGSGGTTTTSVNPNSGGTFSFSGIPIGTRTVSAIYRAASDTVTAYVSVLPKTGAIVNLRLPSNPFAATGGGGGGGGGAVIEYVAGTASSPGNDVYFDIFNSGSAGVAISWLRATYSRTAYFSTVKWGGTTVFDETNPRAGTGDTCHYSVSQTLGVGATTTIKFLNFKSNPTGGSNVDMSSVDFAILFSNGSTITFNSGP